MKRQTESVLPNVWFSEVEELRPPQRNNDQAIKFCKLVDKALYTTDKRAIRHLFESLTDVDCGGVLESVYNVLGTISIKNYYEVLFDLLPSLLKRAPNSAAMCLDFPGRDLSTAEMHDIQSYAKHRVSKSSAGHLVSIMEANGMSVSENHEEWHKFLLRHIGEYDESQP